MLKEDKQYGEHTVVAGSIRVGEYDRNIPYEVDMGVLYFNPSTQKYQLLWASGCSCWSGEWYSNEYTCLEDVIELGLTSAQFEIFTPEDGWEYIKEISRNH